MTPRTHITLTTGAILALTLAGCGGDGGAESSASEREPELEIGMIVDVGGWTASEAAWGNEALFHTAAYDTLLRTEADGTVAEGLATDWSWDESGTELTLTLRDDVTFHDGAAFTAEVAKENLERFRDGGSENAANLAGIEEITVDDDHTLTLHLNAPDPSLETYLSQNAGLQASPESFDEDTLSEPAGSGPYEYDAAASIPGNRYVFTAAEDYWDPEIQHYDRITMHYYDDATATLNALRDSQVDYANLNSTTQIADAEAAGYETHMAPVNWKGYILADRDGEIEEPLADVRVRQAFNYAFDREALLEAIEGGHGEVTTQIFGPETSAYVEELEDAYPYDPDRAQELLAEAGYPDGITIRTLKTSFTPDSEFELISGMLAESGITVEADQVGSDFIGDLLGGRWGAFNFGLNQEPEPWMTYQLAVAPNSAWNIFSTEDETVSDLAERMRTGDEQAGRELNEHLVEEAWFAPMYRVMGVLVTHDGTHVTNKVGQAQPNLWDIVPADDDA